MKDEEFSALKLKMAVIPEQVRWDEPRFDHWIALHAVADEARARVGKAYAAMGAIEQDVNLTNEGKRNARTKVASQAVAEFEKSNTLERARSVVKRQCQTWDDKFGLSEIVKPAESGDNHTAVVHGQIRDKVAKMSKEDRLVFLQKHGSDPLVASALLCAPSFLSDLTDAEATMVRTKLERSMIPPEVSEARLATKKALASAEKGWARAIQLITERGGLKVQAKAEVA